MNREVVLTYLEALIQSTEKKGEIIEKLLEIAKEQETAALAPKFDLDEFTSLINQKDPWIQQLTTIDNGFGQTFERIKEIVIQEKDSYRTELLQLQDLISSITTKAVELQALEKRNKSLVDRRIAEGKQKIKTATVSNKIASSYYQNMSNQHYNDSYFLDKRK